MDALRGAVDAAAHTVAPSGVELSYGTAGFRARAELMDAVFLRCGMLAALRSLQTGMVTGVMVTASHNPIEDNGVKLVDPDGGMLARAWEKHACELARAAPADVASALEAIAAAESIALPAAAPARVHLGRDTRPSSDALAELVVAGARALGAEVTDRGIVTTPELHHSVRMANLAERGTGAAAAAAARYAGADGYYRMLADAYREVLAGVEPRPEARGPLVLDCANGVGAVAAAQLAKAMEGQLVFELRNTGATPEAAALLNNGCGAEHAQKERRPPAGFDVRDAGSRCASVDGDADRLVYHWFRPAAAAAAAGAGVAAGFTEWRLLDGDKIACLAASLLRSFIQGAGLAITAEQAHAGEDARASPFGIEPQEPSAALRDMRARPVSFGVVQTAYANGASTAYLAGSLALPVLMAKTGVKYVHAAAAAFDVGIYFEANGHGTVLFHPEFAARLWAAEGASDAELEAALAGGAGAVRCFRRLCATTRLVNQAIGDALSDALLVEAALCLRDEDVAAWDRLYEDLPSRQRKLPVANRRLLTTTEDETRLVEPAALQARIAELARATPKGRAFARPSGTEDVVRVYAEAEGQAEADELALLVAQAVYEEAGGVGPRPASGGLVRSLSAPTPSPDPS